MGPRVFPLALLLAVALPLLAEPASADHVYSHQYVLRGRALDALGDPVANVSVNGSIPGIALPFCDRTPPAPTSPMGDFEVCFHAHHLPRNASLPVVTIAGENFTLPLNVTLRQSVGYVRLANTTAPPSEADLARFERTYRVSGRVLNVTEPVVLEGVVVAGDVVPLTPVEVVITYNGATVARGRGVTNLFGDYVANVTLGEPLREGTVEVSVRGRTLTAPADPEVMRSDANFLLGLEDRLPPSQWNPFNSSDFPGSNTPGPGALAVLLAVGALALVRARRR